MTRGAKLALLFVVFVDLIGQGLLFPILDALIMEPGADFLPSETGPDQRHLDYGLVIGSFFLAWFLGVIYISKVSDAIGRKNALLICLAGAFVGYAVTIVALAVNSLGLLVLGRVINGFTAGNQPIAQAAMIDGSRDAAERDRNMGYIVTGVSLGLVGGPIIGGVLSDKSLLGDAAGFFLPLYAAIGMVVVAMLLVVRQFRDSKVMRGHFAFRAMDLPESFLRIRDFPLVIRLMPVYALFMIANVTFYIFLDNYLTSAFGYGVPGASAAMMTVGVAVAISGTLLVGPVLARFSKRDILAATLAAMFCCALAFATLPVAALTFAPVFVFFLFFGVSYPMVLGIFSSSVSGADQGWVMGVTTAVFCLAGGIMSLLGGVLMDLDIRLPFYISATAACLSMLFLLTGWRGPEMSRLIGREA